MSEVADLPEPKKGSWDCHRCTWSGRRANLDSTRWEMKCPECGAVLNDQIARLMEQNSGWSR